MFEHIFMTSCLIVETVDGNDHRGCAYLQCRGNDVCVHRKFRCKDPPCPSMLYCSRSRTGKCLNRDTRR